MSSPIPAADRVPLRQKIAFSLGGCTDHIATGVMTGVLWMPFFNKGLGLDPAKLGVVLVIFRLWDAITDPLMGWISDNTRSPWGRRRPFMVAGAVLVALLYPLFWHADFSSATPWIRFELGGEDYVFEEGYVRLCLLGMLYFTCVTIWTMPYYGMQLELTPNYDERTRVSAGMAFAGKFAGFVSGWFMALVTSSWFQGFVHPDAPYSQTPDLVGGMRLLSWFVAAAILVLALAPGLFVKERYYAREAARQEREPFWAGLGRTVRCGPLWSLIGVSFFVVFAGMSVAGLGQYINTYYINRGDWAAASVISGWSSSAMLVTGLLSIPFWTRVSERLDKKTVVAIILVGGMCGHLLNWFCLRPDMPYLQLVPAVFHSFVIAAIWLFLPSMKADVADHDELHTGKRREGAINAFYSWFIKASLAASFGVGGLVLKLTGFDVKLDAQPPEVISRMVLAYLAIPLIIYLVAIAFALLFPLDRARMLAVRAELETRRGTL